MVSRLTWSVLGTTKVHHVNHLEYGRVLGCSIWPPTLLATCVEISDYPCASGQVRVNPLLPAKSPYLDLTNGRNFFPLM